MACSCIFNGEQQRKHAEKQSCKGCLPKEFQDASRNQNRINDLKILKPAVLKWDGSPIIILWLRGKI
jgi:hypothetical protein